MLTPNTFWRTKWGFGPHSINKRLSLQTFKLQPVQSQPNSCQCAFAAQVDNWLNWMFGTHDNSDLIKAFLQNMKALSKSPDFKYGVPIASLCSGWGVAEMVLNAINEKMEDFDPTFPKTSGLCQTSVSFSAMFIKLSEAVHIPAASQVLLKLMSQLFRSSPPPSFARTKRGSQTFWPARSVMSQSLMISRIS